MLYEVITNCSYLCRSQGQDYILWTRIYFLDVLFYNIITQKLKYEPYVEYAARFNHRITSYNVCYTKLLRTLIVSVKIFHF